jgi:hypothetical protein
MLSNTTTGGNVTFVNMKSPKDKDPYFAPQVKEGDKWVDGDHVNTISGNLVAVSHGEYEYEGKKKKTFKFELQSEGGNYVVESNLTGLARSIINCLANAELGAMSDIKIVLYQNKKGFPGAAVTENGKKLEWKYSFEELPKPETAEFAGEVLKNWKPVNDFFINIVEDIIAPKVNSSNGDVAQSPSDNTSENFDDVPWA